MQKLFSSKWVLLIILSIIWGSSFIFMKRGLESFTYYQVATLRIVISFIILLPFTFKHLHLLKSKYLIPLMISGYFGNAIPAFLFTKAQTVIDSSISGILNSVVPLFTLIIGYIVFKQKIKTIQLIGVLLGLFGTYFLITAGKSINLSGELEYYFYAIAGSFCYAISLNTIKYKLKDLTPITITSLAFLTTGPFALVYLFTINIQSNLSLDGAFVSLAYIIALAVFGTCIAIILFNKLIKKSSAIFTSSITYVIPIVAITIGWLDGEKLNFYHLISIAIILGSVFLVNRKN